MILDKELVLVPEFSVELDFTVAFLVRAVEQVKFM
jgi:hypothetical protein